MSQAAGYLHALAVEGREARDRLLHESKWDSDRLRGFVIGSAVADRAELCERLRRTLRDQLAKLRALDPAHPHLAQIEHDLALVDREPIDMTWLEPRPESN